MEQRTSLYEFMANSGFNQIKPVKANVNGYKFVTLISSNNAADPLSVYFGKDASVAFEIGQNIDVHTTFVVLAENGLFKLTNKSGDAKATLEAKGYVTIEGLTGAAKVDTAKAGLKALVGVSKEVRQLGMEIANADTDPQEYCDDVIKNGTFTDAEVKYLQSKVPALIGG